MGKIFISLDKYRFSEKQLGVWFNRFVIEVHMIIIDVWTICEFSLLETMVKNFSILKRIENERELESNRW